ncbi:MAG: Rrf2 family transcriptional regulator [Verrucomicrobiota bacterium]
MVVKVGTKLEYACRVAIQLAVSHEGDKVIRVEDLASREGISASFLVQILNDLKRGGIVVSKRGKMGGYGLARHPRDITFLDVVEALEGKLLELDAEPGGASGKLVVDIWKEVADSMESKLRSHTLESAALYGGDLEYHI